MKNIYDYLVIGAGPAGLQIGYYLQKNKHSYLILEKGKSAGTFFTKYPRHRTLISINKKFTGYKDKKLNLRWDWNSLLCKNADISFTDYTDKYFPPADLLVKYLSDFAKKFKLNIKCNTEVVNIHKDELFKVKDKKGNLYYAKRLIVSTGIPNPHLPNIPGIELTENYAEVSVKPEEFKNKKVLILGKGNSGFETADNIIPTSSLIHIASPSPLQMAWRSHFVGHLRAVNNNFLDTYQLKQQNAVINAHIKKIELKNKKYYVTYAYTKASSENEILEYDRVITCTGFKFDSDIFDKSCKPELTIHDRFPNQTSWYESTNVKDLFFASVLMQVRDFKKEQSAFIHGFRYNIDFLARYLEHRYHHKAFPAKELPLSPKLMMEEIIRNVNRTSALWQQTGYLSDVITFSKKDKVCHYYEGVPTDFVSENHLPNQNDYLVITLEFGLDRIKSSFDVFGIERPHKDDYKKAHLSTGIHPVIRYYHNNKLKSELHLIEDFDSVWQESVHTKPLLSYLKSLLGGNISSKTNGNSNVTNINKYIRKTLRKDFNKLTQHKFG